MNVGFAGTPAFAAAILGSLLDAGFAVPLVITQPDRPRGRGLRLEPSPVKALATQVGLSIQQPATLATEAVREELFRLRLDVLVVAAYGLILPPPVLAWPRHGCINVHASLLPRWRGAAPIQRALLAGDAETGITLMQMDAGLDTGPMIERTSIAIGARDTAGTLEEKLSTLGATATAMYLRKLGEGSAEAPTPQPAAGATYAAKIDKSEAVIDWRNDAIAIDRQIRAFDPAPGAHTVLDHQTVKLWRAQATAMNDSRTAPGTVFEASADGIRVACGTGSLRIVELQPSGGKRMSAAAFVAGRQIAMGVRLGFEPTSNSRRDDSVDEKRS